MKRKNDFDYLQIIKKQKIYHINNDERDFFDFYLTGLYNNRELFINNPYDHMIYLIMNKLKNHEEIFYKSIYG